jgi:omega-amidase
MKKDLLLTLIQSDLKWEAPSDNLRMLMKVLPPTGAADLVILPEMFVTGFTMNPQKWAIPPDGDAVQWMRNQAQQRGYVLAGSLAIKESGQYFNRLLLAYPDGKLVHYDKRHLFGLAGEDRIYTAGTNRVIANIQGWKVLLQVCYDLRFPVFSRNTDTYDLAIYVANWPERRAQAWNALLPARAIENQCYIAAVNRIGADGNGISHSGDSAVYAFDGTPLTGPISHVAANLTAELSFEKLDAFRNSLPFLKDQDKFHLEY